MRNFKYIAPSKALTKEECHKYHRELWDWLANNPSAYKHEWPGWDKFKYMVVNRCFACYYNMEQGISCEKGRNDNRCMYIWSNIVEGVKTQSHMYRCFNTIYDHWECLEEELEELEVDSEEFRLICELRTKLARDIRDLPLRY